MFYHIQPKPLQRETTPENPKMIKALLLLTLTLGFVSCVSGNCAPGLNYNIINSEFCDKYTECTNGRANQKTCQKGYGYNILRKTCVPVAQANCNPRKVSWASKPSTQVSSASAPKPKGGVVRNWNPNRKQFATKPVANKPKAHCPQLNGKFRTKEDCTQ